MIAADTVGRVWTTANTSTFGSASGWPTHQPAIENSVRGILPFGPLEISVVWDVDQYVAVEAATAAFGEGDSGHEALAELMLSLRELRDLLIRDDGRLPADLQVQLEVLRAAGL